MRLYHDYGSLQGNYIIDTNVDHIVHLDVPNLDVIELVPRISGRVSISTEFARFKDYILYLQEHEFNFVEDSLQWMTAMEDELAFMKKNDVWDSVELPAGCKSIGCK